MKSIIAIMTNVHQISGRSNNGGIPRLPNVEWFKLVIDRVVPVRIWSKLNELLSPIQEKGCNCHVQSVFPIQRAFHKRSEAYSQIGHSKAVSPEKFGDLLDAFHRTWSSNHNHSFNLYPQNTIRFIKNVIINALKISVSLLK